MLCTVLKTRETTLERKCVRHTAEYNLADNIRHVQACVSSTMERGVNHNRQCMRDRQYIRYKAERSPENKTDNVRRSVSATALRCSIKDNTGNMRNRTSKLC